MKKYFYVKKILTAFSILPLILILSCKEEYYSNPHALPSMYVRMIAKDAPFTVSPDELSDTPYDAKIRFNYEGNYLRLDIICYTHGNDAFTEKYLQNDENLKFYYDDTKSMLNGSNTNVSKIVYYYQVEGYDYLIISINQKRLGREQYVTPLVSLIALKTFTIGKSNDQ